jgi:Ni/Fe-hydrogenase subunit HybB-like protein
VIAFKWYSATRYVPSWIEIEITLAVICLEIWAFRWVINRMPILQDHSHGEEAPATNDHNSKEALRWKVLAS